MPSVFSYLNSSHNRSWPTVWKIVILLSMYSWCDSMILYKPSHFSSHFVHLFLNVCTYWALEWVSESYSVMSDSLRPHGLNSLWNSPGQDTGVGSFSLHQGIFPTQVSHIAGGFFASWATGKPKNIGVGCLLLLQGIFPTQESNWGLLHCRQILHQLSYQGKSTTPCIDSKLYCIWEEKKEERKDGKV